MRTVPGAVTVDAPVAPETNSSFIISWDNPAREVLTFDAPDNFENPIGVERSIVSSASLSFVHGSVGFSFIGGVWELFHWSLFDVTLDTRFSVGWTGRNTNGLCTIVGSFNAIEVERTATGFYTVRLKPGELIHPTLIIPAPSATGLPAETSPELRVEDVGMADPDEILINAGTRNKNGQFTDDDLIQDPANFMALIGQQFP